MALKSTIAVPTYIELQGSPQNSLGKHEYRRTVSYLNTDLLMCLVVQCFVFTQ